MNANQRVGVLLCDEVPTGLDRSVAVGRIRVTTARTNAAKSTGTRADRQPIEVWPAHCGAPAVACIIDVMTVLLEPSAHSKPIVPTGKNPLSPKKLLLSKWTSASPADKEKHFVVTSVVEPDPPAVRIEWVEIEAVHSGRSSMLRWRDLTDGSRWRQGWV